MSNNRNNYNREEYKEDYFLKKEYLRILPPGTETNQNIYGHLNLNAGEIAWLKTSFPPENTKIRILFWGQKGSGRVIIAKNSADELKNYYVSELEYEIRCPVVLFQKLRIDVLDKRNDKVVGNVFINMLLFLKSNPKAVNTPIEDIKGLFPIFKAQTNCNKPNMTEKIGEIEFEMNVRFTKQPLLKPLSNKQQDPSQQHLNSSFLYNEMKANQENEQNNYELQQKENRIHGQNKNNQDYQRQVLQQGKGLSRIQEEQSELLTEQFMDSNQHHQRAGQQGQVLQMNNNNRNNYPVQNTQQSEKNVHFENTSQQKGYEANKIQEKVREEEEEEKAVTNVKLQKMLKEKQSEEYIHMMNKQSEKLMEQSTRFDEFEILSPDLELLKLRMDEAELISGLTAGIYADLVNVPPESIPEQENLDLKSVNSYVIHADSFLSTDILYKKKLQKSQLSLTIQVPIFEYTEDGTQKIFYDQLYITCRRQLMLEQSRYEFNQSFPCKLSLSETNISQFTDARIYFQLFVGEEDPSTRIEFARGEFRFDQLLLKPYLRGAFEIPMYASSNFKVAQGNNKAGILGGNTKNLTGKKGTSKTETSGNTQNYGIAGELSISVALLNKISPYASDQINMQPTAVQRQKKEIQTKQAVQKYVEISSMKNIPFQICLFVSSLSNMQRNISVNEQILIRHKIYGRNENLEGVMNRIDFDSKQILFNYKSIMPVDPSSIQKMNIVPFILEIWKKSKVNTSSYSPTGVEECIGLIRFNLKSIPELITNPQAFSSNLYPTMLVEGEMPIWDPSQNRNVGICNVSFAFGTVQQVQLYEQKIATPQIINQVNQQTTTQNNLGFQKQQHYHQQQQQQQQQDQTFIPKNNKNIIFVADDNPLVKHQQQMFIINDKSQNVQNNSQAESQSENIANSNISLEKPIQIPKFKMIRFQNMEYSKEPINKVFTLIMENIRRNKRRAQNILRNFIIKAEKHEKRVTLREFYDFLNDIPIQEVLHIKNGYIHKLISVLDFEESGEINTTDFVKSYNSFLNYEDILRDSYSYAIKEFSLQLVNKSFTIADFERIITRFSEFGFVRREYFKNILEKDFDCEHILVNRLIDLLDVHEDGLIQANMLPDYLRSIEVYEKLNYINCDASRYAELVKQNLQENLLKNEEGVQELIMNDELADKEMSARDIQYLIQGLGLDISFWEATCMIESIRLQLNIPVTDPQDEFKLPFVYLSDWLQFIMKQKKEDPQFNYYSYLVEQRNRMIEEQLINNQISDRKGGLKSAPATQRNQQQVLTENSSNKYTDRSQIKKSDLKQQIQEDDEEDLIQLVKHNYKKI